MRICTYHERGTRFFEKRHCKLPTYRWEIVEKNFQRVSRLQMIEERLDWNPGPLEDWCAAVNLRINRD